MDRRSEHVLVVDDEALVAFDLADIVEESGRTVLGPAVSIPEAEDLVARTLPQVALLDIDVRGELIWDFARRLRARGCAPIFVSADVRPASDGEFADCVFLSKPASVPAIRDALDRAFAARQDG